jgi:lycopene cyclase domain-containing protein
MLHFGQYSYLITTVIFAVGAVLIEWLLAWQVLRRHWKLIAMVALILMIGTAFAEMSALRWRTWIYNPERTFNTLVFGAEIETYFYALVVAIAVASATVVCAEYEDQGLPLFKTIFLDMLKKRFVKIKYKLF